MPVNHGLLIYYIVCLLSVFASEYSLAALTQSLSTLSHDMTVYLADSILVLTPLWLLKRRGYIYGAAAAIVITFITYANLLYFRYWQSFIPVDAIFSANSYNSFVFDSILHLVRAADVIFIVFAAIPPAAYYLLKIKAVNSCGKRVKIIAVALSFAVFATSTLLSAHSVYKYHMSVGDDTYTVSKALHDKFAGEIPQWRNNGFTIYTTNSIYKFAKNSGSAFTLSDSERAAVEDFISHRASDPYMPDSVFTENRSKNLILIIVESLNSSIIGTEYNGRSITPTLDSLLASPGTIATLDVIPQINFGGSADGQMIYNTGMLPISSSVTANLYGDNFYHSLAKLPRFAETAEIICENGSVWNHRVTSQSYGYDHLFEKKDQEKFGVTDSRGADAALFDMATKVIRQLQTPFMLELTTISMHFPFEDANAVPPLDISAETINDKYMRMTNYFDRQLGLFIDRLKETGVFDNSVIIIASDHHYNIAEVTDDLTDRSVLPITFIALNTGRTERISRTVGQSDVYPAILDIMGADSPGTWRGMGMSLLDQTNRSAVDRSGKLHGTSGDSIDDLKRQAWKISDLILRSDYFSK